MKRGLTRMLSPTPDRSHETDADSDSAIRQSDEFLLLFLISELDISWFPGSNHAF
jgi:hypothetical protein